MAPSFYDLLGIDTRASNEQIKTAYRQRAKELHPDLNPGANAADHARFADVTEAYQVLSDTARRTQYDAARSATPSGPRAATGGSGRSTGPFGATEADDAFERAFKKWWERGGAEWQHRAQEAQDSSEEYRRQQAAAWEQEKAEAVENKERFERVKQRTRQARAVRQATILRDIWQTRSGFVWADVFVAAAAVVAAGGVVAFWTPIFATASDSGPSSGLPTTAQSYQQQQQASQGYPTQTTGSAASDGDPVKSESVPPSGSPPPADAAAPAQSSPASTKAAAPSSEHHPVTQGRKATAPPD